MAPGAKGLYLNDSAEQLVIQFYPEGCEKTKGLSILQRRPVYQPPPSPLLTLPLPGVSQGRGRVGQATGIRNRRDERRRQAFPDAQLKLTGWGKGTNVCHHHMDSVCAHHQTLVLLGDGL